MKWSVFGQNVNFAWRNYSVCSSLQNAWSSSCKGSPTAFSFPTDVPDTQLLHQVGKLGARPDISLIAVETQSRVKWLTELMQWCWKQDPTERPPFAGMTSFKLCVLRLPLSELFSRIKEKWAGSSEFDQAAKTDRY